MTTLCSQSCVGRIRSVGVVLYDADRIKQAASVSDEEDVYKAHCDMILNPNDPEVVARAKEQGVGRNYLKAAQNSPIYKLAIEWKLAFPPHPEFRTLPMVWYVPPLGPLAMPSEEVGIDVEPDTMRIPVRYLANLLTAGDEKPVRLALSRLLALRSYMRSVRVEGKPNLEVLEAVGLNELSAQEMYRLLAISKEVDRYVLPTVKREDSDDLYVARGECGIPEY